MKLPSQSTPYLKNGNDYQNNVLRRAWEISGDKSFLYTILGENIELTVDRKHDVPYSLCWNWESWSAQRLPNQQASGPKCRAKENGYFWRTHYDYGICGISDGYYAHIVRDERFEDWEWQIGQCWELYKGGTRFYGKANSWYTKTLITFK